MLIDEIKNGESTNIEFKVEIPKKSEKYIKSIIAFANTAGGKIIIGVDDNRQVIGVDKDEVFKMMDTIATTISDTCYPQIFPNMELNTIDGKCVIVIEIYPGANRPYYIKSLGKEQGTYVRVSGTSRLADEAILKDLELQGANQSFDEMICIGQKLEEKEAALLCKKIKDYMLDTVKSEADKTEIKDITVQNLLNWGVVKNIEGTLVPTNAFNLLTNNTFPFAKIQCALFKGTERVVFIDKKDMEGPIYEQIEEAYKFVLKHINLGAEINGLLRTDTYELPTVAIREAIVNAVVHRNYLDRACVQVAVYDDRVEITSPGMLYGGLTIKQIKAGGSKIRNRCIAEVFSRMKIIESWGTGIKRMFASCAEYGVHEPELIENGDSFRINLYRPSFGMDGNSTIQGEKPDYSHENQVIRGEKPDYSYENPAIQDEKVNIEIIYDALDKQRIIERTKRYVEQLYKITTNNQIFGAPDVEKMLDCSKTTSVEIMKKLRKAEVVVAVKGYGKGKYRFKNKSEG